MSQATTTAAGVAQDAIDLLKATTEHLGQIAATFRAIRKSYPAEFAALSDSIRSGLLDSRHLSDLGLNAAVDWGQYLTESASELTTQLDYAQETAEQAQPVRTPCGQDAKGGAQ
ncbi:hypothetical protein ACF8PU_15030 [Pseudomonas sp. GLN_6]|uniref:hypothetical protein n=1 Tax=Pseudomonas sp. GLN_6 TaxID=3367183 RepID=UPI00370C22E8